MTPFTQSTRMSRRSLLGGLGLAAASATLLPTAVAQAAPRPGAVSFYGPHQAGIAEPPQANLQFAAVDLDVRTRAELITLLRDWSAAAAAMCRGLPIGRATSGAQSAPVDTGEALDLPAANLTITLGFGPSLFRHPTSGDRFGLAAQQPGAIIPIPAFRGDAINPRTRGSDLVIQACADDAQIAMHAVRNLMRLAGARAHTAWTQTGFNRSAALAPVPTTARNLFGFRDGTNNIAGTDRAAMDTHVWVQPGDGPAWLTGGSTLAVRRIQMLTRPWDDAVLEEQEAVFGRRKGDGAPLSGGDEFTPPDFTRAGADGRPLVPPTSHMALAHPSANGGVRIKRRAFNYADPDTSDGTPDVGLFFMSYQRNLATQFVPMQRRLAEHDALNEYIRHTASAAYAIPPGARGPDDYVGRTLLES